MNPEQEPHAWHIQGNIKPLRDKVLVCDMEHGNKTLASGLIVPDDNGKERGIRPRWCIVYAVGAEVDYVQPGDQILVSHGRWTRGVQVTQPDGSRKVVRMVESDAILLVQEHT
jgi:co-chaperonin GroES (HSP10)